MKLYYVTRCSQTAATVLQDGFLPSILMAKLTAAGNSVVEFLRGWPLPGEEQLAGVLLSDSPEWTDPAHNPPGTVTHRVEIDLPGDDVIPFEVVHERDSQGHRVFLVPMQVIARFYPVRGPWAAKV